MHVTIVRPGGVGDSLLTWPALQAIRAEYPDVQIVLHGHEDAGAVLQRVGLIQGHTGCSAPIAQTDYLIAFDYLPMGATGQHAQSRIAKRIHCAPFLHPPGVHQGRFIYEEVRRALPLRSGFAPLPVHFPVPATIRRDYHDAVCLSPGSSDRCKVWPYYRELACALRDRGERVVFLEPPAALAGDEGITDFEVLRENYLTVCRVAAASKLVIGNDSSLAHFCGLSGTPGIALFGPTLPLHWGPLGGSVRVLEGCPRLAGFENNRLHAHSLVIACIDHDCWGLLPLGTVVAHVELELGGRRVDLRPPPPLRLQPGVEVPRAGG